MNQYSGAKFQKFSTAQAASDFASAGKQSEIFMTVFLLDIESVA